MKEYCFSNKINADKKTILKIMLDIQKYNNWNSCLRYQNGEMKVSKKLILKASLDGNKFIKWTCKVDEINKDGFVLSKSFIFKKYMHMKHHFIVESINESQCKVTHKWIGTGLSPRLFWTKIIKVLDKFKPYNDSLKIHIENIK